MLKEGDEIVHPIYGKGSVAQDEQHFNTHQFEGSAVWCCFHRPKTGIAGSWPYVVPTDDLVLKEKIDGCAASKG